MGARLGADLGFCLQGDWRCQHDFNCLRELFAAYAAAVAWLIEYNAVRPHIALGSEFIASYRVSDLSSALLTETLQEIATVFGDHM